MLIALALAIGCGHSRVTGEAARTSALEILVSADPETIDPRFVTDAVGMRISRLVHGGLFRVDPDTLAPLPYVAESYRWE
ncbi:hypothetical protein BH09MYX1_BH09MYX1_42030 [soil metagenome]